MKIKLENILNKASLQNNQFEPGYVASVILCSVALCIVIYRSFGIKLYNDYYSEEQRVLREFQKKFPLIIQEMREVKREEINNSLSSDQQSEELWQAFCNEYCKPESMTTVSRKSWMTEAADPIKQARFYDELYILFLAVAKNEKISTVIKLQ